jgi:hypothetical protein
MGRYAATIGAEFARPRRPAAATSTTHFELFAAVPRGYGISDQQMAHAVRAVRCTLRGYAVLQASNAFQRTGDPDESFSSSGRLPDPARCG